MSLIVIFPANRSYQDRLSRDRRIASDWLLSLTRFVSLKLSSRREEERMEKNGRYGEKQEEERRSVGVALLT